MSFTKKARKALEEIRQNAPCAGPLPLPYLDRDGALVIPFGCDPRYRWWQGGQLPSETEREMKQWIH